MDLKKTWEGWSSGQRQKAVRATVIAVVVLVALFGYYFTGQDEKHNVVVAEEMQAIQLGDDLAEDDIRKQIEKDRERQKENNQAVAKEMGELKEGVTQLTTLITELKTGEIPSSESKSGSPLATVENKFKYPPPPNGVSRAGAQSATTLEELEPIYVGGITHTEGEEVKTEDLDSKKKGGIYLAPGFMKAMLLTGLKAETVDNAKDEPEPMVLRVQKPAVLPNHIKANLKGCFVIANGHGKLNKERVEARLVSLHCMSRKDEAVIDQEIKGFIVDKDGAKGLKGRVVTKMGANLARVFMAGVFGGIGEGIKATNTTTSVSALGSTQTVNEGKQILGVGLGQGISDASADIRRVYLDLVRQSSPIIEIGPTKEVDIVITEGVNLQIKGFNDVAQGVNRAKRS